MYEQPLAGNGRRTPNLPGCVLGGVASGFVLLVCVILAYVVNIGFENLGADVIFSFVQPPNYEGVFTLTQLSLWACMCFAMLIVLALVWWAAYRLFSKLMHN
jgi:hypothetical protein